MCGLSMLPDCRGLLHRLAETLSRPSTQALSAEAVKAAQ